jgi:hypothetical protein
MTKSGVTHTYKTIVTALLFYTIKNLNQEETYEFIAVLMAAVLVNKHHVRLLRKTLCLKKRFMTAFWLAIKH